MHIKAITQNVRVSAELFKQIRELKGENISEKISCNIIQAMCQIEIAKGNLRTVLSDFRRANDGSEKEKKAALFLCFALKTGNFIPQDVTDFVKGKTFGQQKISFRFYPRIKEMIMAYPGKNFEDRLRKLLFVATTRPVNFMEIPDTNDLQKYFKVLPRYGNKWRDEFQYEINRICQKLGNVEINVDAFCGTLGCTALRENAHKTIANDSEKDTINLIKCIQKYPLELALELAAIPQDFATFEGLKQHRCKIIGDVTAAAECVFRLETSYYAKGKHYNKGFNIAKYACRILRLSEKITHFDTHLGSAIPFLRKTLKEHYGEKILVFLDPPYLKSAKYESNQENQKIGEFTEDDHRILVDLMKKKRSDNVNFIYFCRVNKPEIKETIDEFFQGTGFYFVDIVFCNAIERVITTVDMTGTKGYQKY